MNYSNIKTMSIYRKLFGEKKMAHKYVSIERVLNSDDWGLIINKDGELKGLYIPAGREIIQKVLAHAKEKGIERVITLSPLTPMATHFHIRNGAKQISINDTSQNFEYGL